jgi:hypothetical protein
MKLCTIINAWTDTLCLLPFCVENHLTFSDGVIVVWSETSNKGQKDDRIKEFVYGHTFSDVIFHQLEPIQGILPLMNETRKRNSGLDVARQHGFTHFIIADADEFYVTKEVEWEKKRFEAKDLNGLVCGLNVYIKSPTLMTDDHTLVPFIHKLTPKIKCGEFRGYPFAYDDKKQAHIDPSRRLNVDVGIRWSEIKMRHMSYVRDNIMMKIMNSSAKLENSKDVIARDLENARPGYISELYHQPLQEVDNIFNITI